MTAAILFLAFADPGSDALQVFQNKCVLCHGPDVKAPPLGFNWILDLPRLAKDHERLMNLGILVQAGNMPPNNSKTGPLSQAQKAAVGAWIAAGAPDAQPANNEHEPAPGGDVPQTLRVDDLNQEPALYLHVLQWLGKFHLLLLHFPIALIFMAALAESWYWWQGDVVWMDTPPGSIRFCILAAALFAVPVAILGWLHAMGGNGASQPETLLLHRWVGTGGALMLCLTAWFSEHDVAQRSRSVVTRAWIYGSALVIGVTGHFGGLLVHGPNFLDW